MNMSLRPFDTYEYVQELIRGGFTQPMAEANMQALVKALDFTIENKLATKEQLQATNEELKKLTLRFDEFEEKFATFEANIEAKFEAKFATKEELQNAVLKLEKEIHQLEHRLEIKIQNLDHKIDKIFLKTMVATGTMMTILMTITCSVLGILIKY